MAIGRPARSCASVRKGAAKSGNATTTSAIDRFRKIRLRNVGKLFHTPRAPAKAIAGRWIQVNATA